DANDVGNTNNTECLLRFDNIIGAASNQIAPGSLIHAAMLELPSVGPDNMGDGGLFYAMLQPWTDTNVTWSTFGPNGIQPDGVMAASTPTVTIGSPSLNPDVQATLNTVEVTTDVQAWANGSRANNGWCILPWPGGSNGWGFRSSKFSSVVIGYAPEQQRPRLRVYYTAGALALPAVIKPVSANAQAVVVPFTGSANFTYHIWRSGDLSGNWSELGTATCDGAGNGLFNDVSPLPAAAYYRVVYQP
ncbi:MAG TPA: DNRLRE domain-containing protein, partial [Verrucomicrobiae bacterium]